MTGEQPLSLNKSANLDVDPANGLQTGFDAYDITMISILNTERDDTNIHIDPDQLVTTEVGYDDPLQISGSHVTYDDFRCFDDDDNPTLMAAIVNLVAQCRTWIRDVLRGNWITWHATQMTAAPLFYLMYLYVRAGLMNHDPPRFDDQMNEADTIEEIIAGIGWVDTDGVTTLERHWTWLVRLAYYIALSWSSKFPNFTDKVQTTNAATYIERICMVITCLVAYVIYNFILISYIQSDRAMFNLGFLRQNLINPKVNKAEFATSIDAAWDHLIREAKIDKLTGMTGMDANHTQVTDDFLDVTLIDGVTLQDSIYDYKTEFVVPTLSLKLARQLFGIGLYDKNGEKIHFAVLLNGIGPTDSGSYDDHSITSWVLGANTAMAIDALRDMRNWNKELAALINKQQHWTWTDLQSFYKEFETGFSMFSSLKGLIEADAYKGIRNAIAFSDPECIPANQIDRDPQLIHIDSDLITAIPDSGVNGALVWLLPWLIGFTDDDRNFERYKIWMPVDWTENELRFALLYNLLFDVTGSTNWQDYRYYAARRRLVQIVQWKDPTIVECLAQNIAAEEARFENVGDVCSFTNFPSIAFKYIICLTDATQEFLQYMSLPRPKGLEKNVSCWFSDIGHPDTLRGLARFIIGESSGSRDSKVSNVAKEAPKGKESAKVDDIAPTEG